MPRLFVVIPVFEEPHTLEPCVRRAIEAPLPPGWRARLLLVDDAAIAALHGRWLGDGSPTDVITFDLGAGAGLCGDIACSTETAVREAARFGWPARYELAYYAIHGLLHLAGYDDRDVAPRRAMRKREREVFAALGLPAPPRRTRRR